jgi:DNA polymerase elongation subunit (family B)
MMKNFYTNVQCLGNHILYRGIVNGKRVKQRIDYSPSLYIPARKKSSILFKGLDGSSLERKEFETIREAKDFVKQFEGVSGAPKIYGNTRFEYVYIGENHKGMVDWDQDKIVVGVVDIEVGSENGFPDPYKAEEPITAITIEYLSGEILVFACGEYEVQGNETYIKCKDEWTLCKKFLMAWEAKCPDVLTGWNTKFFDVPYLVNRFNRILGEDETLKLSPWKRISQRKAIVKSKEQIVYEILGVAHLDYIELYRWYAPEGKSQESYRLDAIAQSELGEGKLSYDEYDNLHSLYRLNHQKFIEYNIKDVRLILKLEDKLKLIELALTLAYDTKCNYEDVFAQTRMWDALTYNYLMEREIVVPPREVQEKNSAFEGAYVKDPQVGLHNYIASFDLNSLYPHLMMQYCISPENLVERSYVEDRKQKIIQELKSRNPQDLVLEND